jgi:U3 small nucleolar RNA-associated protein 20
VFSRFPAALDFNPLWPAFFEAVAPLMPRLLPEAAAVQPPPLLAAAAALAAAPGLARVLGNLPSVQQQTLADEGSAMQVEQGLAAAVEPLTWPEGCSQPAWAAQGLGGALLSACFAVLSARGCSEGSRDAALSVAEACLALQPPQLLGAVLLPWTGQLLGDLRASIESVLTAAAVAGSSGGRTRGGGRSGGKGQFHRPQRPSVIRQLALLEQLGPHCSDAGAAASLAAALVSLLQPPRNSRSGGSSAARAGGSGGFKRAPLDERGLARALAALTALWKAQQAAGGSQPAATGASVAVLQQHWEVVSLLLGHLSHRESRTAAAAAMGSLGSLMDATTSSSSSGGSQSKTYAAVAALLTALNSWSAATLDEPDYNARLATYAQLQQALWQRCGRLAALPLLLQAFFDARNEGDLALRQAAASALTRAVRAFATLDAASCEQQQQAAADAAAMQVDAPPGGGNAAAAADDPLRLLPRVVYPQIKVGLRCASLAVRQEHAAIIRELVLLLPGRFQDLLPLCSTDAEQDFFLNITHLQIHRRGRALQLLARLVSAQQQQPEQQKQEGHGEGSGPAAAAADAPAAAVPAKKRRKLQAGEAAVGDTQGEEQQADDSQPPPLQPPLDQQQHKPVSARVLLDIAAPLLQQFIFEGAGGSADSLATRGASDAADAAASSRGGHGKKAGDSDREGAVAASAVAALGALAGQLGWQQYSGLLQRWMRLMEQYPRKLIIRAACAVLDAFHFPLDEGGGDGEQEAAAGSGGRGSKAAASQQQQQQQSQQGGKEVAGGDDAASEGEADADDDEAAATAATAAAAEDAAAVAVAARHLLHAKVLPALQSQLVVDDKEVARAPVALAIVKVVKVRVCLCVCVRSAGCWLILVMLSPRPVCWGVT